MTVNFPMEPPVLAEEVANPQNFTLPTTNPDVIAKPKSEEAGG